MDQSTVDAIERLRYRMGSEITTIILALHGKHLRYQHGMSRRAVAKELGVKEKWVRDVVEVKHE